MPTYPQYMQALLVEFANFTPQTSAYTASAGDIVLMTATGAVVVTLPPVTTGGPVTVVNLAAFVTTVKTNDGSQINGASGSTGVAVAAGGTGAAMTKATFASNGSAWYQIG